ncbi:ORF6N domain-containing protein [Lunatibacter salilacus]|uniref:ORF6N domain-containing protein n=1 Tax=Lunatibacter salilacus TaxID=2483804 RepID=UPI00131D06B4|nr:ORF6N domain-containing protein [Lunatibacter salilacus]
MELSKRDIEDRIFTIRKIQVMVDRDLADLYQVDTKVLNQAVKRNINRFPDAFRFQLTKEEKMELVTNCDRLETLKHSPSNPYVFTEQGVAMLSAVLRSDVAVNVSIQIMQAFVAMRNFLLNNASVFQRLDQVELKQLKTDEKLEQIFKALEAGKPEPDKGIFFEGQIFDAYVFVADIIKKAKNDIILIDNYVDESVLTILAKRKKNTNATIFTKQVSKQLQLDLDKHNSQYPPIALKTFTNSHDRFLIIDQKELYHLGASLKDLGKKWFAFSKMDHLVEIVLNRILKD